MIYPYFLPFLILVFCMIEFGLPPRLTILPFTAAARLPSARWLCGDVSGRLSTADCCPLTLRTRSPLAFWTPRLKFGNAPMAD